ncbi:MAG: DUF488 domain-containing protein [Caulobacteraceae bacterium]
MSGSVAQVVIKRIYEPPSPTDGRRILVDRLWPRGVSKAKARLDAWMKGVAPSDELRRWFDHQPERWPEFRRRYIDELTSNPSFDALRDLAAAGPVTLLYGARDTAHNEAVVLAEQLAAGGGTAVTEQGLSTGGPHRWQ